jgi:transposase
MIETKYHTCCGLDVHKREIVACLLFTTAEGESGQEIRTYSATT